MQATTGGRDHDRDDLTTVGVTELLAYLEKALDAITRA